MSIKARSLGSCLSAAAGVTTSGITNATPAVITLAPTDKHGQRPGDRIAVTGGTTGNAINGYWTLADQTSPNANAFNLFGSANNGVTGGTLVVHPLMDVTPFMKGHSCLGMITHIPGSAVPILTAAIEGTNDVGGVLYPSGPLGGPQNYADARTEKSIVPAFTAGGGQCSEYTLNFAMRLNASAYTSGGASGRLFA